MYFTIIEWIIIAIVFVFQVVSWFRTNRTIRLYRGSIPTVDAFSIKKVTFLAEDLKKFSPNEILAGLDSLSRRAEYGNLSPEKYKKLRDESIEKYILNGTAYEDAVVKVDAWMKDNILMNAELVEVSLVENKHDDKSDTITNILTAINTYLIRNKGTIADFNLIKDIIQRNIDALEDEINTTLPIPLYMGLMGTMGGIIIGLFSLPDINSNEFINGGGINNLIGGVRIAMIASLAGLLGTVSNSGFAFKGAKRYIESQKNLLYTFLQTELLPILSQDVNTGIFALNRNIERFGANFEKQVEKISLMTDKSFETLKFQSEVIRYIEKVDLNKMATFNITVLTELKKNVDAFDKLSKYFNQMNEFVYNSKQLIDRTQDIIHVSERIEDVLLESKELQRFLMKHFSEIENRGMLINDTVAKLDNIIDVSLNGLQQHIAERIEAVKEIKVKEEDLMVKSFEDGRTNLSNLKHLETLQRVMSTYSQEDGSRQKEISRALTTVSKDILTMNATLEKMLKRMESNFIRDTIGWFRGKKNGTIENN